MDGPWLPDVMSATSYTIARSAASLAFFSSFSNVEAAASRQACRRSGERQHAGDGHLSRGHGEGLAGWILKAIRNASGVRAGLGASTTSSNGRLIRFPCGSSRKASATR